MRALREVCTDGSVVTQRLQLMPSGCSRRDDRAVTAFQCRKGDPTMSWLFVRQLKPFVLLAGAASLLLNLALLMPAIYMVQVFEWDTRGRSTETLSSISGKRGR